MYPVATVHCTVSLFSFQNLSAGVNLQLWHGSEHKGSLQDNWLSWHLCKTEGQASQAGHGWIRDGLCVLGWEECLKIEFFL